jgi:hypothetical protein
MSVVQTLYRLYLLERKNTNALFIETQRPSVTMRFFAKRPTKSNI